MGHILILGGTGFIGPHMVTEALRRGHRVTVFNRGRNNDRLPPGVTRIEGDRQQSLAPLAGMTFDAVIDNCGYLPRHVQRSVDALRGSVGRYLFISSISAYLPSRAPMVETDPVAPLPEGSPEAVDWQTYGPYKALCEKAVLEGFGFDEFAGKGTVLRPGLIVGPGDPTDRFTYWPVRVHRAAQTGAGFLCPGNPTDPIQVIDVRDLAAFTLEVLARDLEGIFNASGPLLPLTMGSLVDACQALTGGTARPVWVDSARLEAQGVQAWVDMPAWIPADSEEAGMNKVSLVKSAAAGLTTRPILDTLRDTLTWFQSLPIERQTLKAGIASDREASVLEAICA